MTNLNIDRIKANLELNETSIIEALNSGNMLLLRDLNNQRVNLKNMLIDELTAQLEQFKKVA